MTQGNSEAKEKLTGEQTGDSSIFNKFKQQFGEINKRPGFLQVIKMESGITEDTRNNVIMTPQHQLDLNGTRPVELGQSKGGDMNNSSHYYRFKRHSLGYQSQGPALKASPLINIEGMTAANGVREQSQTASGVGAFNNSRTRGSPHNFLS